MSNDKPDDEYERLKKFFFGDFLKQENKGLYETSPDNCFHDWHEITLFMLSEVRCRKCNIKQSVYLLKSMEKK